MSPNLSVFCILNSVTCHPVARGPVISSQRSWALLHRRARVVAALARLGSPESSGNCYFVIRSLICGMSGSGARDSEVLEGPQRRTLLTEIGKRASGHRSSSRRVAMPESLRRLHLSPGDPPGLQARDDIPHADLDRRSSSPRPCGRHSRDERRRNRWAHEGRPHRRPPQARRPRQGIAANRPQRRRREKPIPFRRATTIGSGGDR